ncbi:MAG TPA: hypothetical protein VEI54_04625 [Candidatus Limnocylindrales bacterium]|nr:hypothetical protein [Candidatus Limnocylindrales bacterium]
MSGRKMWIKLLTKLGMGLGALCVVGVLLAAIPNHHAPAISETSQDPGPDPQPVDHSSMPGMSVDADAASVGEHGAMLEMQHMNHRDTPHMHMTSPRPQTADDQRRAEEIAEQLRGAIEKYKDYRVALSDGYKIFLPKVPQQEYHFTNYANGFLEAFNFDPARPTSLLYRKTANGFELAGAMYTMPKWATEDQLNERVPLSVATWHQHTNLCLPPRRDGRKPDWTKFGLRGTITTQKGCDAAGGRFYPVIFGWMVHVYPYENTTAKVFAMRHRP